MTLRSIPRQADRTAIKVRSVREKRTLYQPFETNEFIWTQRQTIRSGLCEKSVATLISLINALPARSAHLAGGSRTRGTSNVRACSIARLSLTWTRDYEPELPSDDYFSVWDFCAAAWRVDAVKGERMCHRTYDGTRAYIAMIIRDNVMSYNNNV